MNFFSFTGIICFFVSKRDGMRGRITALFLLIAFSAFGQRPLDNYRKSSDSVLNAPTSIEVLLLKQSAKPAQKTKKIVFILNDEKIISRSDVEMLSPQTIISVKELFNATDSTIFANHVILIKTKE